MELTKEFLYQQFIVENKSGIQISHEFKIPKTNIYRFLDRYNT